MNLVLFKMFSEDQIIQAWQYVKQKNTQGGIDSIQIAYFEKIVHQELPRIKTELDTKTYLPFPYIQKKIPKNKFETRNIALASIQDKIVQYAIKQYLEPQIDSIFIDTSYAYRKIKGARKSFIEYICE